MESRMITIKESLSLKNGIHWLKFFDLLITYLVIMWIQIRYFVVANSAKMATHFESALKEKQNSKVL